jgi:hypothetical protein
MSLAQVLAAEEREVRSNLARKCGHGRSSRSPHARRQAVFLPDALHGRVTDADLRSQHPRAPVC